MTELAMAGVVVPLSSGRSLSPMQRGLWVSQLNHPDAPVQNMPLLSFLDGPIDPERLAEAFHSVVTGSDALRTRLSAGDRQSGGQWRVNLIPNDELPPTEIVELAAQDVEPWARARGRVPLDLRVAGYDSAIAVHGDGTASWYLNLHHVITDATSSALVFRATARAYESTDGPFGEDQQEVDGPAGDGGSVPLTPYYRWARTLAANLEHPVDSATERAVEYWRHRRSAARLGRLYKAADAPTPAAERLALPIGPELLRRAGERLAGDYRMLTDDLGWSTLLVTATALYCHRITGATDFAVGLPVHNRRGPVTREMIGPTMEMFPVDVSIAADDTFRTLHKRISRAVLTTLRHAAPGTSPAADYEAVVNVIPRADQHWFGSIPATTRWLHAGAIDSSHLLRVQMTAYSGDHGLAGSSSDPALRSLAAAGPEFALDVNHGVADIAHRRRAPGHFISVLSDLVTDPDGPIGGRTVCGPDELDVLQRWESTPDFTSPTALVIDRLAQVLVGNPSIVIEQAGREATDFGVSGAELWRWIANVAIHLHGQGVTAGDRVAVDLPRSVEAVVAIMAVMAAGGSFVPLDPSQPEQLRHQLAARAGCAVVLSAVSEIAELREVGPEVGEPASDFRPQARPGSDEAYLLFTSGSTGEPKGVPISEGGLARYIRFAEQSYFAGRPSPVAPLFSPLTFDLTITSLFAPILAGGKLVVVAADGPAGLSAVAGRPDINWCKATPSHLEILVRLLPEDHRLRTLVVGGEAFGSRLAADLLHFAPDMAIFNEYGPTEAVVGCMLHELEAAALDRPEVPIGRPAPGVTLMVVDDYLQRVPIGSPGELCIAHDGLTGGYLGSEPTGRASSSVGSPSVSSPSAAEPSPFVEIQGRRFYRSGDLVRLQDPDQLVYLGRKDEQVKVGGIRLEPIEVEARLNAHRAVARSAVRLWSPAVSAPRQHCSRCGLPDNVPGVVFDEAGVCQTCHAYDRVAPMTESWFKTRDDLDAQLARARARRTGPYDCLHLLSGGKDSTYALYQLVEAGFEPYAFTLDNGFISEGAKENIRRSVTDLGIDHEFATTEAMNAIFRDSLQRHSNVCHGCYKTIYTIATNRAAELGAPLIVTGLSRGQLFETRLIPQQFSADRFDPDAIDRAVIEARKIYHRLDDGPNRMLDNSIFDEDDIFERIEYLDIYRYLDVELSEMLRFLDERAPWTRPADTGRSTNCLINAAGIHTHQTEQGYHNYAVPYAWDVRLGHKTRTEAIEELDDRSDQGEVDRMLAAVGHQPRPREILTAWIEPAVGADMPSPAEFRSFLAATLPGHAIPSAFVEVDELPINVNGKLDQPALPPPQRVHRPGPTLQLAPAEDGEPRTLDPLENTIIELWERILQIEPIGPDDDFFAMGGDSLAALEMIVALGEDRGATLSEDLAFTNTTPRQLATAVERSDGPGAGRTEIEAFATSIGRPPARSSGELGILFEQADRPTDIMYNVGRVYRVEGTIDPDRFLRALRAVADRHQPLSWSHGTTRRRLSSEQAVSFTASADAIPAATLDARCVEVHRQPFDLENGPLLRCLVQPIDDGTTALVLAVHHASGDALSFAALLEQVDDELAGIEPDRTFDYAGFCAWQQDQLSDADRDYWLDSSGVRPPSALAVHRPTPAEPDGFISRRASASATQLRAAASASPAAVAIAAVASTVRAYSDGPDIELGLITSTRNHPEADPLFGYLLNTLPIRIACPYHRPSVEAVRETAKMIGGALAHRAYPPARIAADRQEAGRPAPKLDVMVAFDELDHIRLAGARAEQRVLWNGNAVVPLTFFIELRDDDVELSLEHRGSIVGAAMARRMLDHLDRTLADAVGAAGAETPAVPSSVLVGGPVDDETLVPARIAANLETRGSTAAVICGDEELSWDELGRRVGAVAEVLTEQGIGPGDRVAVCLPRSTTLVAAIVGVQLVGAAYVPIDPTYPDERIAPMAARAGADVGLVDEAHRSLVARPLVLHDGGPEGNTIDGRPWHDFAPFDRSGVGRRRPSGADPAYVIFTSGSTGEPRGVMVDQRNLAASTNARTGVYPGLPHRFLMLSSVAFDSSIVGLFWTLAEGGTVILPSDDQAHDVVVIGELLGAGVSHTLMVPTLYQGLLNLASRREAHPGWADHVIVAGEACPPTLVRAHFDRFPRSALTNEYGPTEATVWATAHHCSVDDDPVPIGGPIPGTWIAVIDGDPDGHPVDDPDGGSIVAIRPEGVEGELVIGGRGVVDGYLDRTGPGRERFDRLSTALQPQDLLGGLNTLDGRFFRTGDRAVMIDGRVLYLGRADNQLNVGGTRVEPEEIEDVLLGIDGVVGAVVVARDFRTLAELLDSLPQPVVAQAMADSAADPDPAAALLNALRAGGDPQLRLVAHLEADAVHNIDNGHDIDLHTGHGHDLDLDLVRRRVAAALPPLLRPAHYEIHAALPTTPNGKLDRQAAQSLPVSTSGSLGRIAATGAEPTDSAPETDGDGAADGADAVENPELADSLARIFAETLRVERFGPDDSFFDHGGHSLLAMELLLAIEQHHHRRLPASAIYAAPTPRQLATRLVREPGDSARSFTIPIQPRGHLPPIFAIHVLGVDCEFFRPLAARLGDDRPMYGLGQPTTELDTAMPTDVAAVAAAYADEIGRIAPDGPVSLMAISLGGVVAYELAQQLLTAGRDVSLLTLFDALGPESLTRPPSLRQRLEAHGARIGTGPRRYLADQLNHQGQRLRRNVERLKLSIRQRLNIKTDHQLDIRRFIEDNVASQRSYVYDPYPGPMLVIKAGDDPLMSSQVENRMGWGAVATGGLLIDTAPGGHLSIMVEPNVAVVAESVDRRLSEIESERRGHRLDRRSTERTLIGALRSGRLPAVVGRLAAESGLEPGAAGLVADVDRVLVGLAETTADMAATVARQLIAAGIRAEVAPVPTRLQHATASIAVKGPVAGAVEVMARLGFWPIDSQPPAATIALVRSQGHLDFVRRGSATDRVKLAWHGADGSRTATRGGITNKLIPTRSDVTDVDPPGWAPIDHWPVRAGRVAGRQLRSAAAARRSKGTAPTGDAPADLGIFLGTPPGLIGPLLKFADVEPGQTVVDIGCGDGRVLIEAATANGCRARGYETDHDLVLRARAAATEAGVADRVEVIEADASGAPLGDADVVFAFLPPESVAAILEPILDQLTPEARFLSHEQLAGRLPIEPDRTGLLIGETDDPAEGGITVANLWYGRRRAGR